MISEAEIIYVQTVKLVDIKQVVKQTYSDTVQYNLSQPINTDIRLNKAQKYKTDIAYTVPQTEISAGKHKYYQKQIQSIKFLLKTP